MATRPDPVMEGSRHKTRHAIAAVHGWRSVDAVAGAVRRQTDCPLAVVGRVSRIVPARDHRLAPTVELDDVVPVGTMADEVVAISRSRLADLLRGYGQARLGPVQDVLARAFDQVSAEQFTRLLDEGALLFCVEVHDPEQEAAVSRILLRHAVAALRIYDVIPTASEAQDPFPVRDAPHSR